MRSFRPLVPTLLLAAALASGCASARFQSSSPGAAPITSTTSSVSAPSSPQPVARSAAFSLFPVRAPGGGGTVVEPAAQAAARQPAELAGEGREGAAAPLAGLSSHPFAAFGHTVLSDTAYVLSAPLHWEESDWLKLGVATAGIALTMHFDESIAHHVQAARSPASDRVASMVEPLGEYGAFGVIGGFYLAGSLLHDDEAKSVAVDGLVSSIIAGGIITPAIKEIAGRSRPSAAAEDGDVYHPFSGSASFPSGHTTEAFALASVIASHYDKTWVKALSYGLASLVGLARMDHDAHFASDVLAGALIGTVVGKAVVHLNDERRGATGKPSLTAGPFYTRDGPGVALHLHF